ncbi:MAG: hypothetical protein ABUL62_32095 [Myxococcales bacterium]
MKTSRVGNLTTNANRWRMVNDFWDKNGPFTLALWTKDDFIAVEDRACNKGKRISSSGDRHIRTKDLSGGRKAVAFFNRGSADVARSATLPQLRRGAASPRQA